MTSEVNVRLYIEGDEEDIINLLDKVFDGWPHRDLDCTSLDHWQWKFKSRGFSPRIAVAEHNGTVVGINHSMHTKIKIGDKIVPGNQGTDLAIHPDYRKMGLYKRMTEAKLNHQTEIGDMITYSVTSVPRVIEIAKKIGRPMFPKPIKKLVKIQDIDYHTKMKNIQNPLLVKIGFKTLSTAQKLSGSDYTSPESELVSKETPNFDSRYDVFWEQIMGDYRFIVQKTSDYLNWRYCDPRGGKYTVRSVEDDTGLLGYVVLKVKTFNSEYPEGYIVDLLCHPGRPDVVSVLLSDSVKYFDKLGLNAVHVWGVEEHPNIHILKSFGFQDTRDTPSVQFAIYKEDSEWYSFRNAQPNQMSFQLGDTDWI